METTEAVNTLPYQYWIMVALMLGFVLVIALLAGKDNKIKGGKFRVKNGPLGDAKFASEKDLDKEYITVDFDPQKWRKDPKSRPTEPGYLLGNWHVGGKVVNRYGIPKYIDKNGNFTGGKVKARVFTDDQHALLVASSGAGKSAFFLYPSIEYALATGQSIIVTDTKGDNVDRYAPIAEAYNYKVLNFHLGNPLRSCCWNMLAMTNKYNDLYKSCSNKKSEQAIQYKAKAEAFAKICADTIIKQGTNGDFGSNSFFYDSACGLLQAAILLVSEYAAPEERHIVSVYKLIQELSGTVVDEDTKQQKTRVQEILDKLPEDSKIRMFAGASAQSGGDAQASVVSTALSRLLTFLDSEVETMICGKSDIDAEDFANNKTILFITLSEAYPTRHCFVTLLVSELYRELLQVSSENGNHVPKPKGFNGNTPRITYFLDEFGTLGTLQGIEQIMSASRSRGIFLCLIIQGVSQLERNYGKESAKIIMDNCKLVYFTGISAISEDAERFSKLLGKYTVQTNSVSSSTNGTSVTRNKSRSLQMTAVDLMSPEEIRHQIKQGDFIIMRTSQDPIRAHFDLYVDWGITLKDRKEFPARQAGDIKYTNRKKIIDAIEESKRGPNLQQNNITIDKMGTYYEQMNKQKAEDKRQQEEHVASLFGNTGSKKAEPDDVQQSDVQDTLVDYGDDDDVITSFDVFGHGQTVVDDNDDDSALYG